MAAIAWCVLSSQRTAASLCGAISKHYSWHRSGGKADRLFHMRSQLQEANKHGTEMCGWGMGPVHGDIDKPAPAQNRSTSHDDARQDVRGTNVSDDVRNDQTTNDEALHCQMCEVSCFPCRSRKFEFEKWWDAAQTLAKSCLRLRPTLPKDVKDLSSGVRLPLVCCAFQNCIWTTDNEHVKRQYGEERVQHPCDSLLQ